MVTVGHVPLEISRLCFYFLQDEGSVISGKVVDTRPRRSSISSAGLEVKLMLKFSGRAGTVDVMKQQIRQKYSWDYTGAPADQLQESITIPRPKKMIFNLFFRYFCKFYMFWY